MSKTPVSKSELVALPVADRFLEELDEHSQDAKSGDELGSAQQLVETFNNYARPKRNFRIAIVAFVGTYTFLSVSGFILSSVLDATVYEQAFMDSTPWAILVVIPGFFFFIPVAATYTGPVLVIAQIFHFQTPALFTFIRITTPLVAAAYWTILAYALCFQSHQVFRPLKSKRSYENR